MATNSEPFSPGTAGTVSRSVSGTTANVALAKGSTNQTVMVTSPTANAIAFIEFGDSTVAAVAATGTPVLPGTVMVFTIGANVTHMAAIGSAGTLYATVGYGA
jgi:hypothetical protein